MAEGIVVPVLGYSVWNFYGVTSATGQETVILANDIPIPPYVRFGLSLRQHRLNVATSTSLAFSLRSVNPSQRDGADFLATTVLGSTANLTGTAGAALLEFTSGNGFSAGLVTNGPHPMARLLLTVTSTLGTAALIYGIFSADLILRPDS